MRKARARRIDVFHTQKARLLILDSTAKEFRSLHSKLTIRRSQKKMKVNDFSWAYMKIEVMKQTTTLIFKEKGIPSEIQQPRSALMGH